MFLKGHEQIVDFLTKKWQKEKNYRLRKELVRVFAWIAASPPTRNTLIIQTIVLIQMVFPRPWQFSFTDNKIAVQFWYEYQDAHDGMKWKRCYGLEDWTFAADGRMRKRQMSGNDVELAEGERWFAGDVDVNTVEIGEEHW